MFVFTLWLVSHEVSVNIQYCFGMLRNKVQKQPLEMLCKKKMFLKFCKIHWKTPVPIFFFFSNKIAGLWSATLLKKRPWHRCFSMIFAKFFRTRFAQNTSGRLLLWTTASETSTTKYLELIERRSRVQENNMPCTWHVNVLWFLTNEKHSPKSKLNESLIMACLQIYQKLSNIPTFPRVHSS